MLNSERILVVEDNETYAKIIETRLVKAGYTSIRSADGLNGYAMARKLRPDLILLDLMLPDLDGHKVCRLIKFDANLRRIPIVIFTSRDTDYDRKIARLSRADAFVAKTASPEAMMAVVQHELRKTTALKMENGELSGRNAEGPLFEPILAEPAPTAVVA
jgi:DNA-binding response OmpR family regulator